MADPITTYAIDNGGPYNVIAHSYCRRIEVRENYNSSNPPTADLQAVQSGYELHAGRRGQGNQRHL